GWKFVPGPRENAQWQSVTLPHTWNVHDTRDDEPGYRRGVSWYRRELTLDKRLRGRRVFLHFEGVGQVAEVFVNDRRVGKHIGGYTAFSFDVTEFLKPDSKNVIDVSADNTLILDNPPIDGDFNMYGGIYRDVWLIATDYVRLGTTDVAGDGIAITTPDVSSESGTVEISGNLINDGNSTRDVRVWTDIMDPAGQRIATTTSEIRIEPGTRAEFRQHSIKIKTPRLWSPGSPSLYKVRTKIVEKGTVIDDVTNPLGFRKFRFDAEQGFFLNGEHLKLRGTNRHQDIDRMANAVPDNLHVRDLEIIKENGFNFVRLAHYPQDPSVLDAADRLGLIIWEEIPIVNPIHISETFNANAKTMLREMIAQHRNHPSIVMWGYMNEVYLRSKKDDIKLQQATVALARELENICRTEDPSRVTVIAFDGGSRDAYYNSGLVDVTQVVGWNLYSGWYSATFEDFSKFVDEFHRKYPNRPLMISEYGANADRRVHAVTPIRFDSSIEWQQKFHEYYLREIEARPFIAGAAIWNQFDFGAEYRGETIPHINQKGMYTYDRQPKDVSYLYRASYVKTPVVHIAVSDWPKRSGPQTQTVQVYSNLARVELFHNDMSLGVRETGSARRAEWTVNFIPGRNSLKTIERSTSMGLNDRAVVEYIDPSSTDLIAVNCGANTEVIDASGTIWQADVPMSDKRAWSPPERDVKAVDTRVNILGTDDDAIFQTMREGPSSYTFAVPAGRYEIELRFAEPKFKTAGERVFGVKINGEMFADRLDVFAATGYMTQLTRRTNATVTGTTGITIDFLPIKNQPIVSGIRVRRI
ncbi:MAG TPA: glycoside hydrolase family 2 TIM barrel-domain containing protein, partial [Pyrinomonadaceae bacterium]|nr:glycoside hydrolase family 2 TIM barrel-domain containing protein [Pyrinomonadaceae bacterium]